MKQSAGSEPWIAKITVGKTKLELPHRKCCDTCAGLMISPKVSCVGASSPTGASGDFTGIRAEVLLKNFLKSIFGLALQVPGCEPGLFDQPERGFSNADLWRDHVLRLFIVLFAREAFLPAKAGETFHDLALREGQFWEARVAKSLSETVFTIVFPTLSDAIAKADPKRPDPMPTYYLGEVRQGALILLYRLLFVLYAEDRNLLPDESGSYSEVCLTRMRLEIADRKQRGIKPSASFVTYWPKLTSIFRAIGVGDDELGIPPYNGGLFDPDAAQILDRIRLPDTVSADIIFGLSHDPLTKAARRST